MSAATEYDDESIPHPPQWLVLAPPDLCLLPLLKEHLRGTQFSSDNDVIASVDEFLQRQEY